MNLSIDNTSFCPGCNRRFCRCDSYRDVDPVEVGYDDSAVSHDYSDDGPDLWPNDEDWPF